MSYSCSCLKCKSAFISEDAADFDGEAFCPACKEANKVIAQKIDAQIAVRRTNKGAALPNAYEEIRKVKNKSVVHYMNI